MALFLITAPSGAGKTTIAKSIEKHGEWKECVSVTTREKRTKEVEGKSYYFVSKDDFLDYKKHDLLIEHVEYDGNYYGMLTEEIRDKLEKNKHAYMIVEYNGYLQIKNKYPDAIGIFLHMSKEDCMANMLLRGDKLESASSRIAKYDEEIKNKKDFDYVIKNVRNKMYLTVDIVRRIISQHS